nr:CHAD domain-containing protein [Ktedonobacteraceae bacterium]
MAKAKPMSGLDAQAPTGKNARIIARFRLEEMYEWDQYVDSPYHVRKLHDLRIAAKRLRYTLEIFADVLPEECQQVVKELTNIQDEIGALHDSDVMIALLRLCLGSQDSGEGYEDALVEARKQHAKKDFTLAPELVADLLEPKNAPSAEERYGLEQILLRRQQIREEQYQAFRQHWYELKVRDFRREILSMLDA